MAAALCHHSLRVREASEVVHSIYIEASVGMCCVTVCTDAMQWTLEHWHVVEVKVNLSVNFMSVYDSEWAAECPVERIHNTIE